jgi:hypothetical protein
MERQERRVVRLMPMLSSDSTVLYAKESLDCCEKRCRFLRSWKITRTLAAGSPVSSEQGGTQGRGFNRLPL